MKKRLLPVLLSFILLTSCAPAYIEESSAVSEDQSVIPEQSQDDSVLDDMTFPDRYHEVLLDQYKGKNAEQLEAEFDYSVCGISEFVTAQTALSVFFPYAGTVYRFRERNGRYQEIYELLLNFIATMFSEAFVIE